MKYIKVTRVNIQNNIVRVNYECSTELRPYFNSEEADFWVSYSENISYVPSGIAVIPFVCNVLPIIWLTDATLYVHELDKTFFESIKRFKRGYVDMYPMLEFKGSLEIDETIPYMDLDEVGEGNMGAFFSGGVDAFTTLICHRKELPILITLRGSDVALEDEEGWKNVYAHLQDTVKDFELPNEICITSNFRLFINECELQKLIVGSNEGWWHGFQHGIGIISQAAPVAYVRGIKQLYIASSLSPYDKNQTCASYPTIDENLTFANTIVVHDQFGKRRQEKVQTIVEFCKSEKKTLTLRVCYSSSGGRNCCHCEKCYRTLFALLAEGEQPEKYGLTYSKHDLKESKKIVMWSLCYASDVMA